MYRTKPLALAADTSLSRLKPEPGLQPDGGHPWCYNGAGSPIGLRIYLARFYEASP